MISAAWIFAIAAVIIVGAVALGFAVSKIYEESERVLSYANQAHGQEPDLRYACEYRDQYPFNEICKEQRQLIERFLVEVQINDVLRDQCDRGLIDKSLCMLGEQVDKKK